MQTIASGVALMAAFATLCLAQAASAQADMPAAAARGASASHVARPDPLDPKAKVLPLTYRSAFEGYRPNVEAEVGAWKDANDTVHRAGGWRAYARGASQPDAPVAPPAAASASMPAPKPSGHAHH